MSITLAEAKVGMADKVDQTVIDEFRRDSFLLDKLVFDDAVAPGTGGSTLTYGYQQLKTPSTAGRRSLNGEYTADEAVREKKSADLDIFGGSFEIDRVIQNTSGAINEIEFQLKEKIKAASNYFHYVVINGSTASETPTGYVASSFDGLRALCDGTSTESEVELDISTTSKAKAAADDVLVALDEWLAKFAEKPDMLLMNAKMLAKLTLIARAAGYYTRGEDSFGRPVDMYNGIALVDAGQYYNGTTTVDCIETDATTGETFIIGLKIGLNALHGVAPTEKKAFINTYLPDLSAPGAVKKGEAEMVAGIVLKNTKMAGIISGLQVAPANP